MAYSIVNMYVASSMYKYKCPYTMTPQYITVHNTSNDASARNEVAYMRRNYNYTSFHAAVDDKEVVLAVPFTRNAYHAGDGKYGTGNRKSIGIEICYSKSGGERFSQAEKNAAKYIASILKSKGWGIDRVKRHKDWSGKNCPHRTMSLGWDRFLDMISAELHGVANVQSQVANPVSIAIDGKWGKDTTLKTQKILGTYQDSIVSSQPMTNKKYLPNCYTESWKFTSGKATGSSMVKALQKLIGATPDGFFGKKSVIALQKFLKKKGYYNGRIDGSAGFGTVSGWQRYVKSKLK